MQTILVTGGAGFIGSNFILYYLRETKDFRIINFDFLTYAGNLENLTSVEEDPRYEFVKGDIADTKTVEKVFKDFEVDYVVNFAAESHVDRSILDPGIFIRTNVLGTQTLLDCARAAKVTKFLQVSTDEVYGSLGPTGAFTEKTPLAPNSPYSASKTGADLLVRAAFKTFGQPCVITRCSNNYGPYQFPEKLIPLMISNAMEDRKLPIYGDGQNIRDWLYVEDHCSAIRAVLEKGEPGEVFNIGGNQEKTNLEVVETLLAKLGKDKSLIEYVKDRPGHDRRYAIDASYIHEKLGWEPSFTFEQALSDTVDWYIENRAWWERVKSGAYQEYYETQYGDRLKSKDE
ncbi:MAG: dTDP-glucose 4,6-dehydratase [Planctomycetota bacterium]|jgi:dTDP-glucose 4,6-dehydratase